jgi:hypothetical protein
MRCSYDEAWAKVLEPSREWRTSNETLD